MSTRQIKAVAEAIADAAYTYDILGRGGYTREEWMKKYGSKYIPHAQAAIAASDAALVQGLVEALRELKRRLEDTPDDLINDDGETDYWEFSQDGILDFIDSTLATLPEEYRV